MPRGMRPSRGLTPLSPWVIALREAFGRHPGFRGTAPQPRARRSARPSSAPPSRSSSSSRRASRRWSTRPGSSAPTPAHSARVVRSPTPRRPPRAAAANRSPTHLRRERHDAVLRRRTRDAALSRTARSFTSPSWFVLPRADGDEDPVAGVRVGDVRPSGRDAHLAPPHPSHEEEPRDHGVGGGRARVGRLSRTRRRVRHEPERTAITHMRTSDSHLRSYARDDRILSFEHIVYNDYIVQHEHDVYDRHDVLLQFL